jgi:hypothetical protein
MNKQIKVNEINQAIQRSEVAIKKEANAHLLDGRIEYTMKINGYFARVDFYTILGLLHGEDIRALKAKYGRN